MKAFKLAVAWAIAAVWMALPIQASAFVGAGVFSCLVKDGAAVADAALTGLGWAGAVISICMLVKGAHTGWRELPGVLVEDFEAKADEVLSFLNRFSAA